MKPATWILLLLTFFVPITGIIVGMCFLYYQYEYMFYIVYSPDLCWQCYANGDSFSTVIQSLFYIGFCFSLCFVILLYATYHVIEDEHKPR